MNSSVKDCGINFNWAYFGMTLNDCQRLAEAVKKNTTLQTLIIQSSGIDDDKCRILSNALIQNTTISKLSMLYFL